MSIKDIYSQNIVASIGFLDNQLETNTVNLSSQRGGNQKVLLTKQFELDFNELANFVKSMATIVDDIENKFVVEESDKDLYETKITYNGQGLDNEEQTYIIYYKETIVNDDDKGKDKDEVETTLEGIAIVDGQEYKVFGEKEVEKDELEIELEIIFDKDNYVKISQEKENNKTEYEYEVVKMVELLMNLKWNLNKKMGKWLLKLRKK